VSLDDRLAQAREILLEAVGRHRPVAIFAAYSGGNDSIVATHFTLAVLPHAKVLHINTGIGIPATRCHVRSTCSRSGWDLVEVTTPVSYEDLVLGRCKGYMGGFPGRGMHRVMYNRLKERPLRMALAEAKRGHHRHSRVLIVSGIRADESKVRTGYQRTESKVDSQVWVNPLYWCSHQDFADYRALHGLPRNPVKDTVGISGECLCGAYADPGELLAIKLTCRQTWAYLVDLEDRVRAAGFPWGWEDQPPKWWFQARAGQEFLFDMAGEDHRPMCHSCEKVRILDEEGQGHEEGREGEVTPPVPAW
jgi:3'-phosphoadenosine 5'-phosphosulfate sulfotransferase (PAPS reductase)/FAD synthetase